MNSPEGGDAAVVRTRWPELAVAAFLMAIGGLVITDALRVGIGWAEDGPRSGYFPFFIGCALLAASAWVFVQTIVTWARERAVFAERAQVAQVIAVLVPMTVYVAAIFPLGIYLASALLIAYFMRRYGAYRWLPIAAVALGVPLVFFLVFERWFLVPLPKGPIERLLGF
jgi:putative tricarboxylic transport membrane protein